MDVAVQLLGHVISIPGLVPAISRALLDSLDKPFMTQAALGELDLWNGQFWQS